MKTQTRRIIATLAAAGAALAVAAGPAAAHEGHRSCQTFGTGFGDWVRSMEPGEAGAWMANADDYFPGGVPAVIAYEHHEFCAS